MSGYHSNNEPSPFNKISSRVESVLTPINVIVTIILSLLAYNLQHTSSKFSTISTQIEIANKKHDFWEKIAKLSDDLFKLNSKYQSSAAKIGVEETIFFLKSYNERNSQNIQLNTGIEYASVIGQVYEVNSLLNKISFKHKLAVASLKDLAIEIGVQDWSIFANSNDKNDEWTKNNITFYTNHIKWIHSIYKNQSKIEDNHIIIDEQKYEIFTFIKEKGRILGNHISTEHGSPSLRSLMLFVNANGK